MYKYLIITFLIALPNVRCETGQSAWLRYSPVPDQLRHNYTSIPSLVVTLDNNDNPVITSSVQEITRGLKGLLGLNVTQHKTIDANKTSIIISTLDSIKHHIRDTDLPTGLSGDGYYVGNILVNTTRHLCIIGRTYGGALYGTFALLKQIALHKSLDLPMQQNPNSLVRYANEWDNLDGSIERGFAGKSIFYSNNNVVDDLTRAEAYARLLASIGINGCAVNNVNANTRVIQNEFLPQLQRLARVFSRWSVRVLVSVDFASPHSVGGLDTYDPLDTKVIEFWTNKTRDIYKYVPDLAGYVLKADAEGRPGPSKYNRTAAQAGNALARALKPYGGLLFYRGFVYGYPLNFTDQTADRAVAAYHNFAALDGQFDDNVVIQIKYGPIDFQIREGISPLLGALTHTNVALEVEVTQEYTGQQRHTVFLAPMWKWVLDFDMRVANQTSPVKTIISSKHRPAAGGLVGVINVGLTSNWMGNHLAMANVYALGRLAWDPDLTTNQIADEWTRLTFGHNQKVVDTVVDIQVRSYDAYAGYSDDLGAGGFTNVPASKYGPNVMSTEGGHTGWGQFHRANSTGIGNDRTMAGLKGHYGTGFIGEYNPEVQRLYELVDNCPDNLLLFMHHVNYTHKLQSGKTVIQHMYDSHYTGADTVRHFYNNWLGLKGLVDDDRYETISKQLHYQTGHSVVWRDSVCQLFYNMSGIKDSHDRIGHYEGRIEAETMHLTGYTPMSVHPWETASGGLAIECKTKECRAETKWTGSSGTYYIDVQYYDENDGKSSFKLHVGQQVVAQWVANDSLPNGSPCGDTSTRFTAPAVQLSPGVGIVIEGVPQHKENAVLDYIEIKQTI